MMVWGDNGRYCIYRQGQGSWPCRGYILVVVTNSRPTLLEIVDHLLMPTLSDQRSASVRAYLFELFVALMIIG